MLNMDKWDIAEYDFDTGKFIHDLPHGDHGSLAGSVTVVTKLPPCDICKNVKASHVNPAAVDGKTTRGPWANMCEAHFGLHGLGLGVGRGQRLLLQEKG